MWATPMSIRSCTISSGAHVRDAIRIPCSPPSFYLQSNPDVRAAGVNPLVHYLDGSGGLTKAGPLSIQTLTAPSTWRRTLTSQRRA